MLIKNINKVITTLKRIGIILKNILFIAEETNPVIFEDNDPVMA
jgi:hypothetical protein